MWGLVEWGTVVVRLDVVDGRGNWRIGKRSRTPSQSDGRTVPKRLKSFKSALVHIPYMNLKKVWLGENRKRSKSNV